MEYITVRQAAEKWELSCRQVQSLCKMEKIQGALRFNGVWAIPTDAVKPDTGRNKKAVEQQRKIHELLQYSPAKDEILAKAVEYMPHALAIYTPDGTLTYANEAYFRDFFISDKSKILGKLNLLEDEVTRKSGLLEIAKKALQGELYLIPDNKVPMQEVVNSMGNGQLQSGIFYKSILTYPIRDRNNKVAYTVTMFFSTREYRGKEEFIRGREYIENNWRKKFNLNTVAKEAGLGRAQFTKIFKELADVTPYEYYMRVKLNRLKEKLLDINLSVAQAFDACGLEYNGYYAGIFKKQVGSTPQQYRKNNI